jgi:hypothetical protein
MVDNFIEKIDQMIEDVDATIAKSEKTREAVDQPGSCTSVVENAAKLAEQRARGEDETGIF